MSLKKKLIILFTLCAWVAGLFVMIPYYDQLSGRLVALSLIFLSLIAMVFVDTEPRNAVEVDDPLLNAIKAETETVFHILSDVSVSKINGLLAGAVSYGLKYRTSSGYRTPSVAPGIVLLFEHDKIIYLAIDSSLKILSKQELSKSTIKSVTCRRMFMGSEIQLSISIEEDTTLSQLLSSAVYTDHRKGINAPGNVETCEMIAKLYSIPLKVQKVHWYQSAASGFYVVLILSILAYIYAAVTGL